MRLGIGEEAASHPGEGISDGLKLRFSFGWFHDQLTYAYLPALGDAAKLEGGGEASPAGGEGTKGPADMCVATSAQGWLARHLSSPFARHSFTFAAGCCDWHVPDSLPHLFSNPGGSE